MTHKDAARNYAWINHMIRELEREFPYLEKREAARSLGLEHMLPDPEQQRIDVRQRQE